MRVKKRIFSGAVCEQEVYTVSDRTANVAKSQYKPVLRTDEERERHNLMIARRKHARVFNENFSPTSLYSTLTFDNDHEVHDWGEARRLRTLYKRRLQYACPDAKINLYMGRGRNTKRIHFHMVSDGVPEEVIKAQWIYGDIVQIEHLRKHNYYNGIDHGCDYTGLANYLFDHWTPEQGTKHRYLSTRNMRQPESEDAKVALRSYSPDSPPIAPKGYRLVECIQNRFGYMCFKYIKEPEDEPPNRPRKRKNC